MNFREKLCNILQEVCGIENLEEHGDLDLFDNGLMDSLGFIELLVQIEEELGIKIEPTEVERDNINTANKIIEYVCTREK